MIRVGMTTYQARYEASSTYWRARRRESRVRLWKLATWVVIAAACVAIEAAALCAFGDWAEAHTAAHSTAWQAPDHSLEDIGDHAFRT